MFAFLRIRVVATGWISVWSGPPSLRRKMKAMLRNKLGWGGTRSATESGKRGGGGEGAGREGEDCQQEGGAAFGGEHVRPRTLPELSLSQKRLFSKLTCWLCGTKLSTLEH